MSHIQHLVEFLKFSFSSQVLCLCVKDPFESKYQLLINGREKVRIKSLKNPKAFIGYSQTIDYVNENLEDYNPTKKRRVLLVFDYMAADMESKKKKKKVLSLLNCF